MRSIKLFVLAWFLCFVNIGEGTSQPRPPSSIAVLFPDVPEPTRSVFLKIIEGIEDKSKTKVFGIPVEAASNASELSQQIKKQDIKTVIALGNSGIKIGTSLDRDLKILLGGVIRAQANDAQQFTINTLVPDPALLFARLKSLMPQIKKVHVVYDGQQNAWLIRLAQQSAKAQGLELIAQEAGDIKAAMLLYQQIVTNANPKTDALWLPQNPTTVQDSVVLPLVLRNAWSNNLAVFSSTTDHVQQGVLFSLFPDLLEYGRKLGQMALQPNTPAGIYAAKELQAAINVNTANHLHLDLSSTQLQEYKMTFPE